MRRFRYKKDEAYVWESDEIRVEFSNICITANKKKEIKQDDIEDLSYCIRLYKGKDRKLIAEKDANHTSVLNLSEIIDKATEPIIKQNAMKTTVGNTIYYRVNYQTEGFPSDDFYEITRTDTHNTADAKKYSEYNLYIGISMQSDLETEGFLIRNISKNDIILLWKCIEEFIDDEIKRINETFRHHVYIRSYEELDKKQIFIANNQLYKYMTVEPNGSCMRDRYIDTSRIKDIRKVGDRIEIKTDGYETEIVIKKIEDNKIISTEDREYAIEDIQSYSVPFEEDTLQYDIIQIAGNFMNVMTEQEWDDFNEMSEDEFLFKYREAILNRTKMFVTDHNLPYDISVNVKNEKERERNIRKNLQLVLYEIERSKYGTI